MERPVIFLDDGGVMNDNQRRGPQWQRHVADFLAPRLGGRKRDWRRANAAVAARLFRQMSLPPAGGPDDDFRTAPEPYLEAWLVGMCQEVDRQPPDGAVQRLALAREASAYVTRHVHAAIPGAVPAIRALWRQGYTLHTASSEFAADLDGYLRAMGVRDCFGTLYGCDVLGVAKAGPGYYERLFEHARVEAASALVVDDMEQALDWAVAAGARTVLCAPVAPFGCRHGHVVSLAALPPWLRNAARDRGLAGRPCIQYRRCRSARLAHRRPVRPLTKSASDERVRRMNKLAPVSVELSVDHEPVHGAPILTFRR